MWKLAAAAILCALVWTAFDRRGTASDRLVRFGMTSFGFFALITAASWLFFPAATSRTVVVGGGSDLTLQLVEGRSLVILWFGLVALAAAWDNGHRVSLAAGPFAYNMLMAIEAVRAQFTPLANLERWLYVSLHSLWAITFGMYLWSVLFGTKRARTGRLATGALLAFGLCFAAIGLVLMLAPGLLVPGDPARDPLLFHTAHSIGAALIALGAMAIGALLGKQRPGPLVCSPLMLACVALAWQAARNGQGALTGALAAWNVVLLAAAWSEHAAGTHAAKPSWGAA